MLSHTLKLDMISKQIHDRAVDKACKYLVAEADLLSAIIEVDRHKLYEKFDERYLTPYCVKYLNLSEDVAAMFVRVARKSQQVPELELAVQEGLQMSKAKTIASVIDTENKEQWIQKAQTLTKEKLEREVVAANPLAPKLEKAKPTGPNRIRIEFEVTYEDAEVLKRARELMSQKKRQHAQIGETYITALKEWVDREDPVRKAERAQERKEQAQERKDRGQEGKERTQERKDRSQGYKKKEQRSESAFSERKQSEGSSSAENKKRDGSSSAENKHNRKTIKRHRSQDRSAIPAHIVHQVNLRDRGGCRKRMPDGSNCGCRQWTEIHHIVPKAYGGTDTVENLITLCSAHHRQLHERSAQKAGLDLPA